MSLFAVSRGEGTPVLLLHGFGGDHRNLLPLDPVFDGGAWRRVYVDLPGMGRSVAGPEIDGTDAVVEAVAEFVDAAFGDLPFAIVGYSFGGMIARGLAARYGDRVLGLALLCAVFVAERGDRVLPAPAVLESDPALLATLDAHDAREYAQTAVVQSAQNWALFRDSLLPGTRLRDAGAMQRISSAYALAGEPEAAGIACAAPTTIITGRFDHVVGYRDALDALPAYPRSSFVLLDRAGHNAHIDQPVRTAAILAEWLDRVVRSNDSRAITPS